MTPEQRQLEKIVKREHPGLLRGLPGDKKAQLLNVLSSRVPLAPGQQNVVLQQTSVTTSPVPPAELLAGYNREITDGANRLFALVEKQSDHRQEMEKITINTQNAATLRGQVFGFIAVIVLVLVGFYFGIQGQAALSGTIFATTIGSVGAVFVLGRRAQDRNLDKKAP